LIAVTTIAVLVLAGALTVVTSKTRNSKLRARGTTIHDRVSDDAQRLQRQETLADEFGARAHAAQVEIDIKTARACSLQQQAEDSRSAAVTSRDQLDELRRQADRSDMAIQPPAIPRLAG
jgi:hypothetical protein